MKLFLIDGHALIFKMYYAFLGRPMVNSKGVDTSILFGFTKYLLEMIQREKPSHLAVFFDPPGGTFRNKLYPEYKANRGETPQLVIDALDPLTDICKALQIPVLMIPGYEADDVIGAMARSSAAQGFDVYMVTPDKDYGQLVAPHIFQYRPGKSGENEILGIEEICLKWGIDRTEQVIDILTICGDSSDNVPGVQGVGPVGAAKLLKKYGTVESIYEHIQELTPRQQEQFKAAQDHIALSKTLVTIKTDIELDVTAQQMAMTASLTPEVSKLFQEYEFASLLRVLSNISPVQEEQPDIRQETTVIEYSEVSGILALGIKEEVAIDLRNDTICLATDGKTLVLPVEEARQVLENPQIAKYGYDIKSQMNSLWTAGIELMGKLWDIQLMHYLLNPERSHQLDTLSLNCLGQELVGAETDHPRESLSLFDDTDASRDESSNLPREAQIILQLGARLRKELQASDLLKLYDDIEEPLIGVLSRMETAGVKIDLESLKDFADELRQSTVKLEKEIRAMAGTPELNVSSPKQIGEVIFEKLRLDPKAKKPSKGSWPTDETTLVELADKHPIIDAILEFRGSKKLLSTYIEPFPQYVSPRDGRVHTTFNQALTSTGRLSSSNPNLQNIPIRTDQGSHIRAAFVAEEGNVLMSADYSQIELRLMAHLCGDKHMTEAFCAGTDVHSVTASKIFKVALEDVTPAQRRVAKTANFGIMYGISTFGLAQRLRCSRSEAKGIIDDYFASFPTIRNFIDDTIRSAREKGYVQTLFGRRRYVPDVNAHNAQIRALAERNAVNAPIQGTAADIIKIAMARVDARLRSENMRSRMVLQIHDELVLEVPDQEIDKVKEILTAEMEGVIKLSVPLTIECNYGKNWLQAH